MDIETGANGYRVQCIVDEDYNNGRTRRATKRMMKKLKKHIGRLDRTSAKARILREIRSMFSRGSSALHCTVIDGRPLFLRCACGETLKFIKWGGFPRRVRYYFSKKRRRIRVQRIRCKTCGSTMSLLPRYLTRFRRFSDKALQDMVDAKLWLYSGYRKIAKWSRVGGCSHTHIIKEIVKLGPICQEELKKIALSERCRFSSIVCIDKIYMRKVKGIHYVGICAIDARYGWVILENSYFAKTPKATTRFGDLQGVNIVDKITDVVDQFMDDLLKVIDPKVIITDNKKWFAEAIDRVNKTRKREERIKHFLCTLHVKWAIDEAFDRGYGKMIRHSEGLRQLRTQFMEVFDAETLEEAETRLDAVLKRKYEFPKKILRKTFKMLEENRERLFPYLKYGLNRTNNPVEFYFGFVKRFQHVSHKWSSLEGMRALLSVYALFYNFMKKMEGPNKGISPYMKARWHIRKDMWSYIDYPRCLEKGCTMRI